jgi:5-methylcytosine-specific restriction endonuclease McrA
MKKCSKCKIEKPATVVFFYSNRTEGEGKTKDGLRPRCKECYRKDYQDNREEILSRGEWVRKSRKQRLINHFGKKCTSCGYDKCISALDFHHINPKEKEFQIGKHLQYKYVRLLREAEKCILLCANCHRELHYNESE